MVNFFFGIHRGLSPKETKTKQGLSEEPKLLYDY